MKKNFINLAIFIFSIVWFCIVLAESESESEEPAQQATEQNKQSTSGKTNANKKPLKEFVPSEEISIDKPVAFPVDI